MGESFNPFFDQGRHYINYVAKELMRHPTFKSDLVIGLACFDYAVLFKLPKTVAVDCYQHLFQSFSSRGWVARELRNVHIDDYVEFIDDVRHVFWTSWVLGLRTWFLFGHHAPKCHVESILGIYSNCVVFVWDMLPLNCLMSLLGRARLE